MAKAKKEAGETRQAVTQFPVKVHSIAKLAAQAKGVTLEAYIIEAVDNHNGKAKELVQKLFE
jgi:hypothetical protein